MYPLSQKFTNYLADRAGLWQVKLNIDGVEYGNDTIVDFTIKTNVAGDAFELGGGISDELKVTLRTTDVIPPNARIVPYLALNGPDGVTEWLPMGEFYVDSREQIKDVWTFSCLDRLVFADVPYLSGLAYPATMQDVWDEIMVLMDFEGDASVVINPAYVLPVAPTGYSCRQVMGFIASANSACVSVSRVGKIAFRRYHASAAYEKNLRAGDYIRVKQINPIKTYTRIVVEIGDDEETAYEAGSGDADHTLIVVNPLGSQMMADYLLTQLNGFSYAPVSVEARGFPQIESGDVLSVTKEYIGTPPWEDAATPWDATAYTWEGDITFGQTVALSLTHTFKGGLRTSLEARSESAQQSEFKVDGSLSGAIKRLNQAAVKLGKPYYGVTVTREAGLKIKRSDNVSELTLNSDTMDWKVNGQSALYLDAIAGKLKYRGDIQMEGGTISWGSVNAPTPGQVGALPSNSPMLTHIGPTGIYTGTLTTDQLIAGTALIGSALIQNIKTNQIVIGDAGQTIGDSLITGAGRWNGRTTLINDSGIYTGSLTAGQINAINGIVLGSNATINWDYMNSDPATETAQNTANGAAAIAAAIAAGTYSGGTFISNKLIYSPDISGGTIAIGSGNSIFKADTNGIYLGNASFASAPFRVDMAGNVYAANGNFNGTLRTATTGNRVELSSNYADINLYHGSDNIFRIYDNAAGSVNIFSPASWDITIGRSGENVFPRGNWNFNSATVSNLNVTAKFG